MAKKLKIGDVRIAKDELFTTEHEYLRQHNWWPTDDISPGTYLWEAKMPDGRILICDKDTAIKISTNMDYAKKELTASRK